MRVTSAVRGPSSTTGCSLPSARKTWLWPYVTSPEWRVINIHTTRVMWCQRWDGNLTHAPPPPQPLVISWMRFLTPATLMSQRGLRPPLPSPRKWSSQTSCGVDIFIVLKSFTVQNRPPGNKIATTISKTTTSVYKAASRGHTVAAQKQVERWLSRRKQARVSTQK